MLNHSNKSKGFLPVKSGPNMTGFDMGKPQSLMEMMQTGGPTTRGGAALARAIQQQADMKRLEEAQRKEAERQGKGRLFGKIASTVGGLLGSALGPVGAGIGAGLGQRLGEGLGAGKSRSYDASGTVFGQQAFRDVDQASRDYTRGMGQRALFGGLEAGIGSYLNPTGLFGRESKIREGLVGGAKKVGGRLGDIYTDLTTFDIGQSGPDISSIPSVDNSSLLGVFGGKSSDPSLFDATSLFTGEKYNPVPQGFIGPSLASGAFLTGMQDGGLLGMQTGGFTAQSVLRSRGLEPTDEQLPLFQDFDPTGLQSTADTLRQQRVSVGQQSRQQQAGTGFAGAGAVGQAQSAIARAAQRAFGTAVGQEQQAFASDTLGTAADFIAGGAEFGTYTAPQEPTNAFGPVGAPTSPPSGSQTIPGQPDSTIGQLQTGTDGQTYEWNGSSWILIPTDPSLGGDIGEGAGPRVTGP